MLQPGERTLAPEFLAGGGEMGAKIRSFNWAATSLGEPQTWSQSLRTCIRIMLSSVQPIWIGWGSELIKLYNDAYIDIVRGKHPGALGQPASVVWKDIWKDIEPMLSKAMDRDEGTYVKSQLLIMERSGFKEETYYTFSYTPVLGDDGKPAGIICYNTADTERIINERALKTLQELDQLAGAKTENDVYLQALQSLSTNNRDFPFALLHTITDDHRRAIMVDTKGVQGLGSFPLQVDLAVPTTEAHPIAVAANENRIVESKNNGRYKHLPAGAWDQQPECFLHVPIGAANRKYPLAILTVGLNPYRKLDQVYRNFIQLVADQVSLSVNNTRAYEEEKRRAEALEALDKAKTLFFTNISHEFRTPITLMLGPLEELLNNTSNVIGARERESLETTHRNAMRLLRLVNTLLDFSRLEDGRQTPHLVPTEINSFTKTIASNFRQVVEKAGLELAFDDHVGPIDTLIDPDMWEKIVFNLLSNAFKYTLSGNISLQLAEEDGHFILRVKDTGVGIPANELPHIFDRFHRVENSAGRTHEGTGIGLSLTKELVQLHKGSIYVTSEPGKGTCFTVSIPLNTGSEKDKDISGNNQPRKTSMRVADQYVDEANALLQTDNNLLVKEDDSVAEDKRTVLLVDDNPDMRKYLAAVLGNTYKIITAENGRDALEKMQAQSPALVVSDIMMPVMDGIALVRQLKSNSSTAQIPIILVTARAGEESRLEGFETGADDYLVKPFSTSELRARIRAQINIAAVRGNATVQVKNLFQQAPTAIQILRGPDFVFELVNNRSAEILGLPPEAVIGRTVEEVFPEMREQGIVDILKQVYETGNAYVSNEAQINFIRNGEEVKTFQRFVYAPMKDENGAITGIMVTGDDVTPQVTARKKIEDYARQLSTLTETLPQLIWMTDGEGRQEFVSGRWLDYSGVVPQTAALLDGLVHPEDKDLVDAAWRKSRQTGSSFKVEVRIKSRTGIYHWHSGQGEPIRNDNGEIVFWIGSYTDINDQKLLTEELQLRDEQKDDFILMASHELKTPVTTIKGYVQLLQKLYKAGGSPSLSPEILQPALGSMDKQINNLTKLITELLDLSKIQRGQLELEKTDFRFSSFIKETVDSAGFISKHALKLDISFDCMLHGDKDRIAQVMLNFITNAIKYSSDAQPVEIAVFKFDDSSVALSVTDYGIGIEKQDLNRIFERFYRVEGVKEKTYPGFGIGLFIAKDIISRHNGSIMVKSVKNEGSTFTFTLPFITALPVLQ